MLTADMCRRLEREEKEQLDKEKRDRLAHLKVQIGEDRQMSRETGEVVYKGKLIA